MKGTKQAPVNFTDWFQSVSAIQKIKLRELLKENCGFEKEQVDRMISGLPPSEEDRLKLFTYTKTHFVFGIKPPKKHERKSF